MLVLLFLFITHCKFETFNLISDLFFYLSYKSNESTDHKRLLTFQSTRLIKNKSHVNY